MRAAVELRDGGRSQFGSKLQRRPRRRRTIAGHGDEGRLRYQGRVRLRRRYCAALPLSAAVSGDRRGARRIMDHLPRAPTQCRTPRLRCCRARDAYRGRRAATGHAYAYVEDYLPFDRPVPFVVAGRYAEAPLRALADPTRIGAYLQGKSIRLLSEEDFASIVRSGLDDVLASGQCSPS